MADLRSGDLRDTDELLGERLDQIAPLADMLGGAGAIENARRLVQHSGAERQRDLAAEFGMHGLVAKLADEFTWA